MVSDTDLEGMGVEAGELGANSGLGEATPLLTRVLLAIPQISIDTMSARYAVLLLPVIPPPPSVTTPQISRSFHHI